MIRSCNDDKVRTPYENNDSKLVTRLSQTDHLKLLMNVLHEILCKNYFVIEEQSGHV